MESQIIDYNEMPSEVNVIEKMNDELTEVQKENDNLKKKLDDYHKIMNKFKMPRIKVKSAGEYKAFEKKLEEFGDFIKNTLEDGKIPSFGEKCRYSGDYIDPYDTRDREAYHLKMTDKLDELTNHLNREWCEYRIELAIEIFLQIQDNEPRGGPYEETFKELVFGIDDGEAGLHSTYQDISTLYEPKWSDRCEHHNLMIFCYYNCEKCGKLDDYGDPEYFGNRLLCMDCHDD